MAKPVHKDSNDCSSSSLDLFLLPPTQSSFQKGKSIDYHPITSLGGGTPILGHIRNVRPEWVGFPGQKPADGCKFLTKNLPMGHNFDIIQPGNGWFFLT